MPSKNQHSFVRSDDLVTPMGVMCFPSLFETETNATGGDTGKYVGTLVFTSETDLSKVDAAVNEVVAEAFPGVDPSELDLPIKDNALKEHLGFPFSESGCNIKFKSQYPPGVFDRGANAVLTQSEIYPGIYGRAKVHAFSWDIPGGKRGVSLRFSMFQKLKDGTPLGGGGGFDAVEEGDIDDLL